MDRSSLLVGVVVVGLITLELQPRRLIFTRADRLSGPLIAASVLAILAMAILAPTRSSFPLRLSGVLIVVAGVGLRLAALHALRGDYTYTTRAPSELCTRGLYSFVRHPAYLGTCLYAVAAPLYFGSLAALALVPIALLAILYRIGVEETLLRTGTPAYVEYASRTPALIPFLF